MSWLLGLRLLWPATVRSHHQSSRVQVGITNTFDPCLLVHTSSNATNKSFRTIEDELVDGLVKIGCVSQLHADEMFKMSFQRAARTDKGVSAAANLVSLKMELNEETTLACLNETLPKQIRVFSESWSSPMAILFCLVHSNVAICIVSYKAIAK